LSGWLEIKSHKAAKTQRLELKKIKQNINNDIYTEENQSDLNEPDRQSYALVSNVLTMHLLPSISAVQAYQYPEKGLS
jgi:hypothetical protein